jgi:hypothetical protein
MLFPTTLVGSYLQPEWLIDRRKLAGRFPPRVRAKELWRIPAPALYALPPLPLFLIKPCGRCWIKEPVFIPLAHSSSCGRPARAGPVSSANHNASWLSLQFDLVRELGFL